MPLWISDKNKNRYESVLTSVASVESGTEVEEYTIAGTELDDTTNWVKREIGGKMAEEIKARFRKEEGEVKAQDSDPVFLTEKDIYGWMSEMTSDLTFECIVEWGGYEKVFMSGVKLLSIGKFIDWLDN